MQHYTFENLNDTEFETLVIRVCKELLGIGCKTFSTGKDGAKDSWFVGTAQRFPSTSNTWSGKFVIQAKHTTTVNASCSDRDFHENQTSILTKEIERLKEIKIKTPFDNYIIFTNRKLSGNAHPVIIAKIQTGLGIQNAEIIGREDLNTYLNDFPQIAEQFGLEQFNAPLRFYEKDLREIILFFSENSTTITNKFSDYITNFTVIDKQRKNSLNGLSKEYFDFLKKDSIQYFDEIEKFLKDPRNEKYTRMYANTVSDLQALTILERNRFENFDHIIKYLIDYVVKNNEEKLLDQRRLVRVFIHFMYFNCDIGVVV